jgi:hypothetical protein
MLGEIGGFFGRLFGSDKAVDSLINHTANALDKVIYTSEEKAADMANSVSEARGMLIEWLKNTQGQNLARRVLAFAIALTWLSMFWFAMIADIASVWFGDTLATRFTESAARVGDRAVSIDSAMMLILTFYFAAPHIGNIIDSFKTGFGKK